MLLNTDFIDFAKPERGKVRDIFDLGSRLLIVTTDRVSAYDHVLPQGIPDRGIILNTMSEFWFEKTRQIVKNHFVTSNVKYFPKEFQKFEKELSGRSMVVTKTEVVPVECIVRGFLAGSAWKEYEKTGKVGSVKLRENLLESQKLDKPIFTPSTKAKDGKHDENITFTDMCELIGKEKAEEIREISLKLYNFAAVTSERNGIYLADTKFEFGYSLKNGDLMLIDEVVTPDSSRFWSKAKYYPGKEQENFDKQSIRDFLSESGWDKKSSPPNLPPKIISDTRFNYLRLAQLLKIDIPQLT